MASPTSLSVVVPTHNRHEPVLRLVEQLLQASLVTEIIVVDDGSDEPVSILNERVKLVRHELPKMVSAARNAGAAHSSGEILFFIDDDCLPAEGTIDRLVKEFDRDPMLGVAGPILVYPPPSEKIWCAGVQRRRWTKKTVFRGGGADLRTYAAESLDSEDFPSAFAIRRACFERVGGFDHQTFPILMEEADLCARIRGIGYRVHLVPEAVVAHDMEMSDSLARRLHLDGPKKAFMMGRGRGRFLRRHTRGLERVTAILFWLLVLAPIYVLAAILEPGRSASARSANVRAFVRGLWLGVFARWQ